MIAFLYGLLLVVYVVISAFIVRKAYRYTKARYGKGWGGAVLAVLGMYGLVFWDLIPVYVAHKYYCSTEAGFWLYKSPRQWIKENPEVIGSAWKFVGKRHEIVSKNVSRFWSTERIYVEYIRSGYLNDEIGRTEAVLVDNATGYILARAVEFYRGNPSALALGTNSLSDYKIWLGFGHRYCGPIDTPEGFMDSFSSNRYLLEKLGKGEVK